MDDVAPRPTRFAVRGPIERADLPGLCDRVCKHLADKRGQLLSCDVTGVAADAVAAEALARLQLAAHRNGCEIRLHNASPALLEILDLMGLTDVLPEAVNDRDAAADRTAETTCPWRERT